jgi:hypothetical protein
MTVPFLAERDVSWQKKASAITLVPYNPRVIKFVEMAQNTILAVPNIYLAGDS